MRFFRGLLVTILVLIIIGGAGYIGWSMFFSPMYDQSMNAPPNTNIPQGTNNTDAGMQHGQMQNNQQMPNMQQPALQNNAPLNIIAIQNKDKLNQAIGTINQAIELITIDPYSKTTVSGMLNDDMQMDGNQNQPSQGTGTINIYPGGNSSVSIIPSGNNSPNNTTSSTDTSMGAMADKQNINYVYDQGKLQQLHNGIYTLAQGLMAINQLNEDLAIQSAVLEAPQPDYQTYVMRYNTALQNKAKLSNAVSMINQANTLVNVNPYASSSGYQIDVQAMQQLHQGIYKLAQGMTMINRLNEDFTGQMAQAAQQMQYLTGTIGLMTTGHGLFDSVNITTIFNIILILMVAGLVFGIIGAIVSLFGKKSGRSGNDTGNDQNTL